MRIGIFGGSFNPPHKMHKNIALELIQKNYIDKIIYVPTGDKYSKKELIEAKHRIKMLELLIKNNHQMRISDYEVRKNLTYTYQTLDYFKRIYPNDEIYFITGSDNLKDITTWKNYKYILNNYKLLVVKRNDDDITKIVNNLNDNFIIEAKINTQNISSSNIRNDIKNDIYNSNIDKDILKYIKRKKLYI